MPVAEILSVCFFVSTCIHLHVWHLLLCCLVAILSAGNQCTTNCSIGLFRANADRMALLLTVCHITSTHWGSLAGWMQTNRLMLCLQPTVIRLPQTTTVKFEKNHDKPLLFQPSALKSLGQVKDRRELAVKYTQAYKCIIKLNWTVIYALIN